jgi:hypothetical protein
MRTGGRKRQRQWCQAAVCIVRAKQQAVRAPASRQSDCSENGCEQEAESADTGQGASEPRESATVAQDDAQLTSACHA